MSVQTVYAPPGGVAGVGEVESLRMDLQVASPQFCFSIQGYLSYKKTHPPRTLL